MTVMGKENVDYNLLDSLMMDKHLKFYEFNLVFLGKDCASFSTKKKNSSNGFKCTCSTLEWVSKVSRSRSIFLNFSQIWNINESLYKYSH